MYARTIKKAIALFAVYSILIIGIFVLQFSNDSIITEKIGFLQITMSETRDSNNNPILKNELQINFNGITFSCDDSKPAFVVKRNPSDNTFEEQPVKVVGWEKQSDFDYRFFFTDDIIFDLNLSDETETGGLSLSAEIPSSIEDFYIPYSFATNVETERKSLYRAIVDQKKNKWEFLTPDSNDEYLHLTSEMASASYSHYVEAVEFKFNSLSEISVSNDYESSVLAFRENIASALKTNPNELISSERAVVAYIAEQASRGRYTAAIDEIPLSFKRGSLRTYLSAPYFNNLAAMNNSLSEELKTKENLIRKAAGSYSLDLFTVRNITDNLYLYPSSPIIKKLLQDSAKVDIQNSSIAECAGVLRVYVEMNALSKAYARHLVPILDECVQKIEDACSIENGNLTISENGTFLSVVQAIEVGDALLRYGQFVEDETLVIGGKALIASYLGDASFDVKILGDLYPVVVTDNTYYPHFVKLVTIGDDVIWAWTVAKDITYEDVSGRGTYYTMNFPVGLTHYVILRGVPAFRNIYIYDTAFRTDPRFETYNSSGYVYESDTMSLLLKSRHRSENEVVRLVGTPVRAVPKPVETTPAPVVENNTSEQNSETTMENE